MANWFYSSGREQCGPVTADDLRSLAASGDLKPSDLLWKEGMGQWVQASKVKDLIFKSSDAVPPPLPEHIGEPEPPIAHPTSHVAVNAHSLHEQGQCVDDGNSSDDNAKKLAAIVISGVGLIAIIAVIGFVLDSSIRNSEKTKQIAAEEQRILDSRITISTTGLWELRVLPASSRKLGTPEFPHRN